MNNFPVPLLRQQRGLHVGRPFNPRHRSEVEDFQITLCVSFLKQRYRTAAPKWLS